MFEVKSHNPPYKSPGSISILKRSSTIIAVKDNEFYVMNVENYKTSFVNIATGQPKVSIMVNLGCGYPNVMLTAIVCMENEGYRIFEIESVADAIKFMTEYTSGKYATG